MSPEIIKSVLQKYQKLLKDAVDDRLKHLHWMCDESLLMLEKSIVHSSPHDKPIILSEGYEKVNRWLGFIQGVLWEHGIFSIDEMREHNTGKI